MHSVSAKAGSRVALTPNHALRRVPRAFTRLLATSSCSVTGHPLLLYLLSSWFKERRRTFRNQLAILELPKKLPPIRRRARGLSHRKRRLWLNRLKCTRSVIFNISHRCSITVCVTVSCPQNLSAKINKTIEQQVVNAASSGKLTIMKNIASDRFVL